MKDRERKLLFDVVHKYYEVGMTQEQIAKEEFISKSSVCRLLKKAVDQGYVRFQINYSLEPLKPLEEQIETRFQMDKVYIAPTPTVAGDVEHRMAETCRAAAADLCKMAEPDDTFCFSWGDEMECLAGVFSSEMQEGKQCAHVVMMNGSPYMRGYMSSGGIISHRIAAAFAAKGHMIHVPFLLDDVKTARLMEQESGIRDALKHAENAQVAVFCIGGESHLRALRDKGVLTEKDHDTMIRHNVAGHISGLCFDAAGDSTCDELTERMVGLKLDGLRKKKQRIAVAVGEEKAGAVLAALKGGLANRLYTDEPTARMLAAQMG